METELARTFLTVISAGNFVGAAERLHVTQSTVSARIQALEQQLGRPLFVRNKAGTTLTAAGRQFQKHAATLVRTVEYARHEVGVARGYRAALTIGGRFGLWEQLLLRWLPKFRAAAPDVSLRAEIGMESELMQGLVEGRIDIGVMYTPQSRPGLKVELLLEESLILVSTDRASRGEPGRGYVYVDWGQEFHARHSAGFPDLFGPALTVNIGWLGLHYILENGGSGYFPLRLVAPHLADRSLTRVAGAPAFAQSAYLIYSSEAREEFVETALEGIRLVARAETPAPTSVTKRRRRLRQ